MLKANCSRHHNFRLHILSCSIRDMFTKIVNTVYIFFDFRLQNRFKKISKTGQVSVIQKKISQMIETLIETRSTDV